MAMPLRIKAGKSTIFVSLVTSLVWLLDETRYIAPLREGLSLHCIMANVNWSTIEVMQVMHCLCIYSPLQNAYVLLTSRGSSGSLHCSPSRRPETFG